MLDEQEVGTIYRIGDEWLWSINLGMMGGGSGQSKRCTGGFSCCLG
ncbi:hypothetical protein [Tardiphaga sp.]|nr:hypothetical protein [Tardiphaga sp.]